jgi:hypothetical protein
LFRERIEVRSLDVRTTLHAEVAVAEVVGEEEDEVRTGRRQQAAGQKKQEGEGDGALRHGLMEERLYAARVVRIAA